MRLSSVPPTRAAPSASVQDTVVHICSSSLPRSVVKILIASSVRTAATVMRTRWTSEVTGFLIEQPVDTAGPGGAGREGHRADRRVVRRVAGHLCRLLRGSLPPAPRSVASRTAGPYGVHHDCGPSGRRRVHGPGHLPPPALSARRDEAMLAVASDCTVQNSLHEPPGDRHRTGGLKPALPQSVHRSTPLVRAPWPRRVWALRPMTGERTGATVKVAHRDHGREARVRWQRGSRRS